MKVFSFPAHFTEEIPIHFVQHSEIISCLKSYFNFSRLFSGIPNISFYENVITKGRSGFCNLLSAWNLILLVNQIFLLVIQVIKNEDFIKKSGSYIILRLHVICVHIWSIFYSKKLISALKDSTYVENRLKIYNEISDITSTRRNIYVCIILYILIGFLLTFKSPILEIILENKTFTEIWETYGKNQCGLESNTVVLSSVTSVYCVFSDLSTNFTWIFGDFLLILLSLVLSNFYVRLNRGLRSMDPNRFVSSEIDLVREHYGILAKLVTLFDNAISSLNLINTLFNFAFIVLGGYQFFTLRNKDISKMKITFYLLACKLGVGLFKSISGLLYASYLHYKAHAVIPDIWSWPMTKDMQDFTLSNTRVGIIHAFLAQLSSNYGSGFTLGKLLLITSKFCVLLALLVISFFAFARITTTACSRNRRS